MRTRTKRSLLLAPLGLAVAPGLFVGIGGRARLPDRGLHLLALADVGVGAHQPQWLATRIALVVSLFEPLMLVLMGAVVLLIVLAILLPILSLNQLVN